MNKEKMTMNWYEYWINHCWFTGWQSIQSSFKIWQDLMVGNYDDYSLLKNDNPFEQCYLYFWDSLGEDNCYDKEFLLYLEEVCYQIDKGMVELIPISENLIEEINELVGDV
jgi:hypothetical protein